MKIDFNIGNASKTIVATLLVIMMIVGALSALASLVKADPGYHVISNPVFYEIIDDQGGAWDTVLYYYREYVDLFSGNWRANLRIGAAQAWIDANYFPATSAVVTSSSITSTLVNMAPNPYGLVAGIVTIDMKAEMVEMTPMLGLRDHHYVMGEPWVMKQTYTIKNTGILTLSGVSFYMYYFPSPYGWYPTNIRPSHVDYTVNMYDPNGYAYHITLYGEGAPNWAYTGLSARKAPTAHDVGHGGGYPDPPYYSPWPPWRPSAVSTDVLRQVENDNMRGWAWYDAPSGSDPNAVAGALKWYIGSLAPSASWSITFLQSVAPHDATISTQVIDIKPWSYPNAINPGNKGVTPVAILTTSTFQASSVNPATVKFGRTGVEASPLRWALQDVDRDGDIDMILLFNTVATSIQLGDTTATLTGQTYGGVPIVGVDSIVTVP